IAAAFVPAMVLIVNERLENTNVKLRLIFRSVLILWYLKLIWILVAPLDFVRFAYQRGQGKIVLAALLLFGLALVLSIVFDALYIGLVRWLIKRIAVASSTRQVYLATLAFGVCLVLVLILFVCPILLGITVLHFTHAPAVNAVGFIGFVILISWVLNLI